MVIDNNNTNFTPVADRSAFFSVNDRVPEAEAYEVSRQDLACLGDIVDGFINKTYSEAKRDEKTGDWYHIISEVSAFSAIQQRDGRFDLDVVAIEEGIADANGRKQGAYRFTTRERWLGKEKVERVILDAHGAFNPSVQNEIILSSEMPTLVFLEPHGQKLKAGLVSMEKSYAEVSIKGITLTSEQAVNDFTAAGYKAITGTSTIGGVRDYTVSKYKEKPGQYGEAHYFETGIAYMHLLRKSEQAFDLLELRKKGPRLSASNLVQIAQEQGHKKIVLAFCRSPLQMQLQVKKRGPLSFIFRSRKGEKELSMPEPETYSTKDTKLLEQPIFYSWDQVKTHEINRVSALEYQAELSSAPKMTR